MGEHNQFAARLQPVPQPIAKPIRLTKDLYTVPELMQLAGITRRKAIYWAEIGLVCPTLRDPQAGKGQPAFFYSATETVKAMIVADLRRCGCSLRQVQQVAQHLGEHGIDLSKSESYLLTDGYSVYYAFSDEEVVDIHKHHRQMLLLVPIHEQVAKLREVA